MNYHLKIKGEIDSVVIDKIYSSVFRKTYDEFGFIMLTFEKEMNYITQSSKMEKNC
jgi:hypothetical protein